MSFLRCICSQDCTSPEASRSHPVQPPGSGGPAPGPDLPHATSHQPAAATSGGCKGECRALWGAWRSGPSPDLSGLPLGSSGPAALSILHLPTHLLPPSGSPEPPLPHPVWGHIQPLWAGGLPVSFARGNWRLLPEEDLLPAPGNPVWPSLCPSIGAGCSGEVHCKHPAFWHSPLKGAFEQGLCGTDQRRWQRQDGVRMLRGRSDRDRWESLGVNSRG